MRSTRKMTAKITSTSKRTGSEEEVKVRKGKASKGRSRTAPSARSRRSICVRAAGHHGRGGGRSVPRRADEARRKGGRQVHAVADRAGVRGHSQGRSEKGGVDRRAGCRQLPRRSGRRRARRPAGESRRPEVRTRGRGSVRRDAQFEVARQFVRLGGAASVRATYASPGWSRCSQRRRRWPRRRDGTRPVCSVQAASGGWAGGRSGRWFRRGRKIIVSGSDRCRSGSRRRCCLRRRRAGCCPGSPGPAVRAARDDGAGGGRVDRGPGRDRRVSRRRPPPLRGRGQGFLRWLMAGEGRTASPAEAQRRFTLLRLMFNNVLTQFDVFADVMTQRSERGNGVWLAGLDVLAEDALVAAGLLRSAAGRVPSRRGHGARFGAPGRVCRGRRQSRCRRARAQGTSRRQRRGLDSRPRVGHQGATLLNLPVSLRPVLQGLQGGTGPTASPGCCGNAGWAKSWRTSGRSPSSGSPPRWDSSRSSASRGRSSSAWSSRIRTRSRGSA